MSNNQNPYDAQYNEWNNMIVPGTGGVTASYAEQRAAGIQPGESAYMAHVKLGVHRANEVAKSYASLNATAAASAAKPMQYHGPTGTSGSAKYARAGSPVVDYAPAKKVRPVVGPVVRRAMSMLAFVLRNFFGIIFFAVLIFLVSYPDINYILRHHIGVLPVRVVGFGAVLINVLWLCFKLVRATARGLKKIGVAKSLAASTANKAGAR
jgi:hypothetical protein